MADQETQGSPPETNTAPAVPGEALENVRASARLVVEARQALDAVLGSLVASLPDEERAGLEGADDVEGYALRLSSTASRFGSLMPLSTALGDPGTAGFNLSCNSGCADDPLLKPMTTSTTLSR